MRFDCEREWRFKWHRWFAWRPVHLSDTGECVWLETVWRRGEEWSSWYETGMDWTYRSELIK